MIMHICDACDTEIPEDAEACTTHPEATILSVVATWYDGRDADLPPEEQLIVAIAALQSIERCAMDAL